MRIAPSPPMTGISPKGGLASCEAIQSSRVRSGIRRRSSSVLQLAGAKPSSSKRRRYHGLRAAAHSHWRRSLASWSASMRSRSRVSVFGFQYGLSVATVTRRRAYPTLLRSSMSSIVGCSGAAGTGFLSSRRKGFVSREPPSDRQSSGIRRAERLLACGGGRRQDGPPGRPDRRRRHAGRAVRRRRPEADRRAARGRGRARGSRVAAGVRHRRCRPTRTRCSRSDACGGHTSAATIRRWGCSGSASCSSPARRSS